MCSSDDLVATRALAARVDRLFWPPFTQHPLCQPHGKLPFTDAGRTNEQKSAGETAAGEGMAKASQDFGVSAEH